MADVVRTRAEMLTLLADNTTGAISAQDMRDILVSLHGVYGSLYVDSDVVSASITAGSPAKFAGWTGVGPVGGGVAGSISTDDLIPGTGGGSETGIYMVDLSVVAHTASGAANWKWTIYVNTTSTATPAIQLEMPVATGATYVAGHVSMPLSITAGQAISVYLDTSVTGTVTIHKMLLSIRRIG